MNSKAKEKDCKSDCEFIGDRTILLILVQDPSDWFGLYSPFKIIQDSTSFILVFPNFHPVQHLALAAELSAVLLCTLLTAGVGEGWCQLKGVFHLYPRP